MIVMDRTSVVELVFENQSGPVTLTEAGTWHIELEFDWPALRADEYTLTVGVGEGESVQGQVVQSWANHIFKVVSSLQGRPGDQLLTLPREKYVSRIVLKLRFKAVFVIL